MRSVVLIALGLIAVIAALFLTVYSDSEIAEEKVRPIPKETETVTSPPKSPPPAAEYAKPSFDIVRVTDEGNAVIAGRAAPGVSISILDGDTLLGTVKADDRGEWVFLPSSPLESGERKLSLRTKNPDGAILESDNMVVLVVPERKEETLALSMPQDGSGPIKPLQTPGSEGLALSIDAVNYDEKGQLTISGQAPEESIVLLYLNNDFLGSAQADDRQSWTISPERTVVPGVYELRADQVDANKRVINRVSIPFSRADEQELQDIPEDRKLVVQPGNSLWRIARRVYGSGFEYAVIYQANKGQITNPDLIYPGQVFKIPEEN